MNDEMMDILKLIFQKVERIEKALNLNEEVISNKEVNAVDSIEDNEIKEIWEKAKGVMKNELTEITYKTWIVPLEFEKIEENTIIFTAPNAFSTEILKERYSELILNAFKMCNKCLVSVKFMVKNKGDIR